MSEKVVLPNFDLPRDSTRIAMRVLWVMGGVVVLATLVLGVAMWHHRSLEIATAQEAAAKAEAARRAAMAPPPAPAPKVVEKTTAPGGSATTLANVAAGCSSRFRFGRGRGCGAARSASAQPPHRKGRPRPRHARLSSAREDRRQGREGRREQACEACRRPCKGRRRLHREPAQEIAPTFRVGDRGPLSHAPAWDARQGARRRATIIHGKRSARGLRRRVELFLPSCYLIRLESESVPPGSLRCAEENDFDVGAS